MFKQKQQYVVILILTTIQADSFSISPLGCPLLLKIGGIRFNFDKVVDFYGYYDSRKKVYLLLD